MLTSNTILSNFALSEKISEGYESETDELNENFLEDDEDLNTAKSDETIES